MITNEHKTLQLFYAGVLTDALKHYAAAGILESVTAKKLLQQKTAAPAQLKQLGINTIEDLFAFFSKVFGCIQWEVQEKENSYEATGTTCLLCSIAKSMGIAQPCAMYCINPFTIFTAAIKPDYKLKVVETLWTGNKCKFLISKKIKK